MPKTTPQSDPYASIANDPYADIAEGQGSNTTEDFTSNPKSEGLYTMASPNGGLQKIPYSKVMNAWKSGYRIDPEDQRRFAADRLAELKNTAKKTGQKTTETLSSIEVPQSFYVMLPTPKVGTKEWFKEKGVNVARGALDLLPTAGTIGGGLVAGGGGAVTGPGDIAIASAGAGAGAALGEDLRESAEEKLFPFQKKLTPKESAKNIGEQALVGSLSEVGGRLLGNVTNPVVKYFGDTAKASAQTGIKMLPSEVSGKAPSYVEKFLKGSILTSGMMQRFRDLQNTQTKAAVERLANSISKFRGNQEELGNLVQDGIDQHTREFRVLQNTMYDDIDKAVEEKTVKTPVTTKRAVLGVDEAGKPEVRAFVTTQNKIVDKVMPSTSELKKFAAQELKRLTQEEKVLDPALLSKSRGMLENILKAPDRVTYKTMAAARSDSLDVARSLEQALSGKESGLAKKMASLFDDSMMDAAEKSGIDGLPEKIREANAFTANEHRMFEQALVKKVVETKNPEVIATLLRRNTIGNQELRDLFTVMPKTLHEPVQRQLLVDTMRQSTNLNTRIFNERKFAESIAKLGDERGQIIFGDNWKNVKQLTRILETVNGPVGIGGGSGAALANLGDIKAISAALAAIPADIMARGHIEAGSLLLGGQIVGFRAMAYALTHPEISTRLVKGLQAGLRYAPYGAGAGYNVGKGQQELENIRKEGIMRSPTKVQVMTPDGQVHIFPNEKSAAAFRQSAGIQ